MKIFKSLCEQESIHTGNSLEVQWLEFHTSTVEGSGKILHAKKQKKKTLHGQKKKTQNLKHKRTTLKLI